jgi:phosphatidylserine/phosphatidylglycerophosphate/cardiolipin synthase-like enzyme
MRVRDSVLDICDGHDLERFFEGIESAPSRYSQVIICSPYIDEELQTRIALFAVVAQKSGCAVRIITKVSELPSTLKAWPERNHFGPRSLIAVPQLHAKVYLALGRDRRDSQVMVTSANLTEAGLSKNIEFGLLVHASSLEGARIVEEVRRFLESLVLTN